MTEELTYTTSILTQGYILHQIKEMAKLHFLSTCLIFFSYIFCLIIIYLLSICSISNFQAYVTVLFEHFHNITTGSFSTFPREHKLIYFALSKAKSKILKKIGGIL